MHLQIKQLFFFINLLLVSLYSADNTKAQESNSIINNDQPMSFFVAVNGGNCDECRWIVATGAITKDTPKAFENFLRKNVTAGLSIALHSQGGDLLAGLQFGRLIRKSGLNTLVGASIRDEQFYKTIPGECSSACAYAFLGGIDRALIGDNGGRIGFHQFYSSKTLEKINSVDLTALVTSNVQLLTGLVVAYVIEMGVDARVVSLASSTPKEQMIYPLIDDLLKFNVIPKRGFTEWKIKPHRNGLIAYTLQNNAKAELKLTAYCDYTGDLNYLHLERNIKPGQNNINYFRTSDDFLWLDLGSMDIRIPHKKVVRNVTEITESINIPVPSKIAKHPIRAEYFNIHMNTPIYIGLDDITMTLSQQDRKSISLAYKNCSGPL